MIEFKMSRMALRLDFSFFAVLALFFWLDSSGFGLTALAVCAVHELGHLAVMHACGILPESVTFYGAGIRISSREVESRSPAVQAAVYSAGCVVNLLLAVILWQFPPLREAAAISLFTGVFNLLPVGEFDGRRLLKLLLIMTVTPDKVDSILRCCGIFSAVLISAAVIFLGRGVSFSLFTTVIYLLIMSMQKN
ncbi:MAG: peptidase M50, partial [Oscillospiraceae bacterium]